jgi:hypothetical protein
MKLGRQISGIFFQKFGAVEIRPQLHAEKQGKTMRPRGQNPLFWKKNPEIRVQLARFSNFGSS